MSAVTTARQIPLPRCSASAARRWLGVAAIGCYALHASVQIAAGRPYNLLWACHVAALAVGVGLLLRLDTLAAAGTLLLTVGIPSWAASLATGGEFFPTSLATHLGGWTCGVLGLRSKRFPEYAACAAVALVGALLVAARLWTPATPNVNLAHRVWEPLAPWIGTGPWHLALIIALWAVLLYVADFVVRWVVEFRVAAEDARL